MNEILVAGNSDTATIFGADNPHRGGLTNTKGISNRERYVTNFDFATIRECDGCEIRGRHLNHGDV